MTFTATIVGGAPLVANGPQAAQSATFKVDNLVMGTANFIVSGADLIAELEDVAMLETSLGEGTMVPGIKTVTAEINNVDGNYNVNPNPVTTELTISQEDANIQYNGMQLIAADNQGNATVNLIAVIQDIVDGYPGDIRNAKVRIKIYNADSNLYPLLHDSNEITVTDLLNPNDETIGIVSWQQTLFIGNDDSRSFGVEIVVSNYYTRKIEKEADGYIIQTPRRLYHRWWIYPP